MLTHCGLNPIPCRVKLPLDETDLMYRNVEPDIARGQDTTHSEPISGSKLPETYKVERSFQRGQKADQLTLRPRHYKPTVSIMTKWPTLENMMRFCKSQCQACHNSIHNRNIHRNNFLVHRRSNPILQRHIS